MRPYGQRDPVHIHIPQHRDCLCHSPENVEPVRERRRGVQEIQIQLKDSISTRSCNRHTDCDAADKQAEANGRPWVSHCNDDCCEECFGY